MYFYILKGPYRVGFGITSNYERRAKDYTGAWGGEAVFDYIFEGPTPHIKRIEHVLKTMHVDKLWCIDEWQTEWLDNGWSVHQLKDFVLELIKERHLKIKQHC
jgi:hypothetical protein